MSSPLIAKSIDVNVDLPVSFQHLPKPNAKNALVLFLHGYTDSGSSLLRRSLKNHSLNYHVLAPNGPFPVPVKTNHGTYKEAYSWYFWDFVSNRMVISPKVAVTVIAEMIQSLGYQDSPKVVVGFSQGGFLAPYLIPSLQNVKGLIAIGSAFRTEDYQHAISYEVHGIHGAKDPIIPLDRSQKSYQDFKLAKGFVGEYHAFDDLEHTIHQPASSLLIEKINRLLG